MSEFPHIRRISAYLFFAWCSSASGVLAGVVFRWAGFGADAQSLGTQIAVLATFLALRDMTTRSGKISPPVEG